LKAVEIMIPLTHDKEEIMEVCNRGDIEEVEVKEIPYRGTRNISEDEPGAFLCCICNVYDEKTLEQ
jgi:hypothetical protein